MSVCYVCMRVCLCALCIECVMRFVYRVCYVPFVYACARVYVHTCIISSQNLETLLFAKSVIVDCLEKINFCYRYVFVCRKVK